MAEYKPRVDLLGGSNKPKVDLLGDTEPAPDMLSITEYKPKVDLLGGGESTTPQLIAPDTTTAESFSTGTEKERYFPTEEGDGVDLFSASLTAAGKAGEAVNVGQRYLTTKAYNALVPEEKEREFSASFNQPKGVYPSTLFHEAVKPKTPAGKVATALGGLALDIGTDPWNLLTFGAASASKVPRALKALDKLEEIIHADRSLFVVDNASRLATLDKAAATKAAVKAGADKASVKAVINMINPTSTIADAMPNLISEQIDLLRTGIKEKGFAKTKVAQQTTKTQDVSYDLAVQNELDRLADTYTKTQQKLNTQEAELAALHAQTPAAKVENLQNALKAKENEFAAEKNTLKALSKELDDIRESRVALPEDSPAYLFAHNEDIKKFNEMEKQTDLVSNIAREAHGMREQLKLISPPAPVSKLPIEIVRTPVVEGGVVDRFEAILDGERIGYLEVSKDGNVTGVSVKKEFQRQGVAESLYDQALNEIGKLTPGSGQSLQGKAIWKKLRKKYTAGSGDSIIKKTNPVEDALAAQVAKKQKEVLTSQRELSGIGSNMGLFDGIPKPGYGTPIHQSTDMYDLVKASTAENTVNTLGQKTIGAKLLDKEIIPVAGRIPFHGGTGKPLIGTGKLQEKIVEKLVKVPEEVKLPKIKKPTSGDYIFKSGSRGRANNTLLYKDNAGRTISIGDLEKAQIQSKNALNELAGGLRQDLINAGVGNKPDLERQVISALESGDIEHISDIATQERVGDYLERLGRLSEDKGISTFGETAKFVPGELRHTGKGAQEAFELLAGTPLKSYEVDTFKELLGKLYNVALDATDELSLASNPRRGAILSTLKKYGIELSGKAESRLTTMPIITVDKDYELTAILERGIEKTLKQNNVNMTGLASTTYGSFLDADLIPTSALNREFNNIVGRRPFVEDIDVTLNNINYAMREDLTNRNLVDKVIQTSMATEANGGKAHVKFERITDVAQLQKHLNVDKAATIRGKTHSGVVYLYDLTKGQTVERLTPADAMKMLKDKAVKNTQTLMYSSGSSEYYIDALKERLREVTGLTALERGIAYGTTGFKSWINSSLGFNVRNTIGDLELLEALGVPTGVKFQVTGVRKAMINLVKGKDPKGYIKEAEALNLIESGGRGYSEIKTGRDLVKGKRMPLLKGLDAITQVAPQQLTKVSDWVMNAAYGVFSKNPKDMSKAVRVAGYSHLRESGYTPKVASDLIRKGLVDYSDLTRSEERLLKQVIPYYVWLKKGNIRSVGAILQNPHSITRQRAIQRAGENVFKDTDQEVDRSRASDNVRYGEGVRLPFFDKATYIRSTNWSPAGSIAEIGNALFRDPSVDEQMLSQGGTKAAKATYAAGEAISRPLDFTLGRGLSPLPKTMIELATNTRLLPWGPSKLTDFAGQPSTRPDRVFDKSKIGHAITGFFPVIGTAERVWGKTKDTKDSMTGETIKGSKVRAILSAIGFTASTDNAERDAFFKLYDVTKTVSAIKKDIRKAEREEDYKTVEYLTFLLETLDTLDLGD